MNASMSGAYGPVMLGVEGLALTDGDRVRLADPRVGGVILFARNFESSGQLRALTSEIRALRQALVIAVDHEGGRVQRFRSGEFTPIPFADELDPGGTGRRRPVDITTESYRVAREYMVRLGSRDFEDPAWVNALAKAAGLDDDAFRARFGRWASSSLDICAETASGLPD